MPVRHPLGTLDGGLKGDSPGDFWVLGSYASKASSYHLNLVSFAKSLREVGFTMATNQEAVKRENEEKVEYDWRTLWPHYHKDFLE